MPNEHDSVRVGVRFSSHVVMATIVFIVVAATAVGLGYFLVELHAFGDDVVPAYVRRTLEILKIGVFAVDIGGYVLYVGFAAISFAASVIRSARRTRA